MFAALKSICVSSCFQQMSDLDRQIEKLRRCELITENEVKSLCSKAREILIEESNVQSVDSPVTVSLKNIMLDLFSKWLLDNMIFLVHNFYTLILFSYIYTGIYRCTTSVTLYRILYTRHTCIILNSSNDNLCIVTIENVLLNTSYLSFVYKHESTYVQHKEYW